MQKPSSSAQLLLIEMLNAASIIHLLTRVLVEARALKWKYRKLHNKVERIRASYSNSIPSDEHIVHELLSHRVRCFREPVLIGPELSMFNFFKPMFSFLLKVCQCYILYLKVFILRMRNKYFSVLVYIKPLSSVEKR